MGGCGRKLTNESMVKKNELNIMVEDIDPHIIEWNKLSTDCVTASSVNMFKNKVDTYLRRAGYK